jgi:hypothetical protein
LSATVHKSEQRWALKWAIVIVGLTCLPYLLAWRLAPAGTKYTGLLINHFDGESYYAKMQQGARGDWLFHLTFSPEPYSGAFIFGFYLALGHLSAITGLSIPLTYHFARVVAGIFFLLVAYRFIAYFVSSLTLRRVSFFLLSLSAGFGWVLAPFGIPVADLWVAEGFSFLSILANPHFPLAIGLMLLVFLQVLEMASLTPAGKRQKGDPPLPPRLLVVAAMGALLSLIQPFCVPVVLLVLGVHLTLLSWHNHHPPWHGILAAGAAAVGATPLMLYDLYVYRTNPALAGWSAQNVTHSLPPWEYALGYGLVLLLALGGIGTALRRREPRDLFLLAWISSATVLLYVPFALQRRFITGLHVPLVLLATSGLERIVWPRVATHRRLLLTGVLIGLTALTNIFVPLVAVAGVAQARRPLVMSDDEASAFAWLHEHTAWTDTVLAPSDAGQFVPAWAGNRVVYGHPFETIDSKIKEAQVLDFYSGQTTMDDRRTLIGRYDVHYVLVPDAYNLDLTALGMVPVWTGTHTVLYRTGATP